MTTLTTMVMTTLMTMVTAMGTGDDPDDGNDDTVDNGPGDTNGEGGGDVDDDGNGVDDGDDKNHNDDFTVVSTPQFGRSAFSPEYINHHRLSLNREGRWAPQMSSQPVSSIFSCSPLPFWSPC